MQAVCVLLLSHTVGQRSAITITIILVQKRLACHPNFRSPLVARAFMTGAEGDAFVFEVFLILTGMRLYNIQGRSFVLSGSMWLLLSTWATLIQTTALYQL